MTGFRLAVKDLFDVAGYPTAAGNPILLAASGLKIDTAPLVQQLLDAGAGFVGKTNTDELAFSLIGNNCHFGMPINPRYPDIIPGGSSSGSAVAVAAGLVDIGLGTDTSGSVRLPAVANGIVGWRPTFGLLNPDGIRPLAPSIDVPGFFTRDVRTMRDLMTGLGVAAIREPRKIVIAEDIMALCDSEVVQVFTDALRLNAAPAITVPSITSFPLASLADCFTTILLKEAWTVNAALFSRSSAVLGADIAERLRMGEAVTAENYEHAKQMRAAFRLEQQERLKDGLLAMPTLPVPPPHRTASAEQLAAFRARSIQLLCLAGLGGFPQMTIPLPLPDGRPAGLSLLSERGQDGILITLLESLASEG